MPRYKLTIAYDGTDFCGWQKQEPPAGTPVSPEKTMGARPPPGGDEEPGGPADAGDVPAEPDRPRVILRTVQETVERAIREVVREPVVLIGASRTDSGVHARGQVGAFTCSDGPGGGWPVGRGVDTLVRAINSRLPEDVLVTAAAAVPESFNPIADCTGKGYSYTLHVSPHRPFWDRRVVQHIYVPMDLAAMNAAAGLLVGEHDFAGFAAAGHGRVSTIRTIFECRVVEVPALWSATPPESAPDWSRRLRIEVSGNGFLWNMVRIIAGTLVEVGRGKLTPADVGAALESGDRRRAGPTLAARGLCLEWVRYG